MVICTYSTDSHVLYNDLLKYSFPQDGKGWQQYKLTNEQVDQYWTNGYLPNIKVLSEEQCDKLLEDYKLFLVSKVYC